MREGKKGGGFNPQESLLNHCQARFAQRLYARPQEGGGPEEILTRDRSTLTTCLRAAAALRRGDTVEPQQWGTARRFPGLEVVESREGAQHTAAGWRQPGDTVWTDGSRLDSREVCVCVILYFYTATCGPKGHGSSGFFQKDLFLSPIEMINPSGAPLSPSSHNPPDKGKEK